LQKPDNAVMVKLSIF